MGWLFAVALGLNRKSRTAVFWALPPIALGHALSIAIVAGTVVVAGVIVDQRPFLAGAGLLLIGWAIYHQLYGHRHRVRVGMQTGQIGLVLWSFLMATAHGAGLMLLPALMPLCLSSSPVQAVTASGSLAVKVLAVGIHSRAKLAVAGLLAPIVFLAVGVAVIRPSLLSIPFISAPGPRTTG